MNVSKDTFYYVYIWVAYNFLDVITTHLGFLHGFPEGNPVPAYIVGLSSPEFLPVYKLTVAFLWLGIVVWLARRWKRVWIGLRLANVLVFATVVWNILLILPSVLAGMSL